MRRFKVKAGAVSGLKNKVFNARDEVTEANFPAGTVDNLVDKGYLTEIEAEPVDRADEEIIKPVAQADDKPPVDTDGESTDSDESNNDNTADEGVDDATDEGTDDIAEIKKLIEGKTYKQMKSKAVVIGYLVRAEIAHDPSSTKSVLFDLLVDGIA